jgi:hypothetical protein
MLQVLFRLRKQPSVGRIPGEGEGKQAQDALGVMGFGRNDGWRPVGNGSRYPPTPGSYADRTPAADPDLNLRRSAGDLTSKNTTRSGASFGLLVQFGSIPGAMAQPVVSKVRQPGGHVRLWPIAPLCHAPGKVSYRE